MVRQVVGDIFDSNAQTLVNTVNCRGVMGKGLALQFKLRFPEMFADYSTRCKAHQVRVGEPYLYRNGDTWILNFPTKDDWRRPSRLDYVERGLRYFAEHYREWGIQSIAFPQLGCQNGGLNWEHVGPLMHRYLDRLNIDVEIYVHAREAEAPAGRPPQQPSVLELINAATTAEGLQRILGQKSVRRTQAEAILEYRERHGTFERLDELMHVPGIKEKTYRKVVAHLGQSGMIANSDGQAARDEWAVQPALL